MDDRLFDSFRKASESSRSTGASPEELWHKLFDTYKRQTEAQLDAFKTWSTKSAEAIRDART